MFRPSLPLSSVGALALVWLALPAGCVPEAVVQGCDAPATFYIDADSDGYGRELVSVTACKRPEGYSARPGDCDDSSARVYRGAPEYCDLIDNDCDGYVDEDSPVDAGTWYPDADRDGYGGEAEAVVTCRSPEGWFDVGGDCDDAQPMVHPGATELCNGVDDDCNGLLDDVADPKPVPWYRDADGDGFGVDSDVIEVCSGPDGYALYFGDCDDNDPSRAPGLPEVCDGLDNDCKPETSDRQLISVNGEGAWSSLRLALLEAPEGAVVDVCPGVYVGSSLASRSVEIRGTDPIDPPELVGDGGGAVLRVGDASVRLVDLEFRGGNGSLGGCIDGSGARDLTLEGVVVRECTGSQGGGIYGPMAGVLTLIDSEVRDCIAWSYGGALVGREIVLQRSLLDGNQATYGGAVLLDSESTLLADDDTMVSNNQATYHGGGAYLITATIEGGTWQGNIAGAYGGGLFAYESTLRGAWVLDNQAPTGGGVAVTSGAVEASLSTTTLEGNLATRGGGAFVSGGGTLVLTTSTVEGNTAGIGGGVYVESGVLESRGSFWGYSSSDNAPDDVYLWGGDAPGPAYLYFTNGETFTCSSATKVCE